MKMLSTKKSFDRKFCPLAISILAGLSTFILLLTGCANLGPGALTDPPPVSAGQIYSNASLTGTYSVNETGSTGSQFHDGSGTLHFDGNGNLTGALTEYYVGSTPCQFSIVGTYSLASSASGTSSLTTSSTDPNCVGSTGTVNIQAAEQGQSFVYAETDGQRLDSGTALKQ